MPGTDREGQKALSRVCDRIVESDHGDVIDLEEVVGFPWDSLAIYDAYTSFDLINKREGIQVGTRWGAYVPEFSCFWIFRQGERRIVGFWRDRKVKDWHISLCEPPFRGVRAENALPIVRTSAHANWRAKNLVWLGTQKHPDDPTGWRFIENLAEQLKSAQDGTPLTLSVLLGRPWSELQVSLRTESSKKDIPGLPPSECMFEFFDAEALVARGLWRDQDLRSATAVSRLLYACPETSGRWTSAEVDRIEVSVASLEDSRWRDSPGSGLIWPTTP